jgi:hypothetical protein
MTSVAKSLEQSRPLVGQTPDGRLDVEKIRADFPILHRTVH